MRTLERYLPTLFVVVAIVFSAIVVIIATRRTLTSVESILLQLFVLAASLGGSFMFGKRSAKDAARDIMKPHARSAFRRLISLYNSLSRVAGEISAFRQAGRKEECEIVLARLESVVVEQLATADDALEDWRDVVPEDVEELRSRFVEPRHTRSRDE